MKTQEVNFNDFNWIYEGYVRPVCKENRYIEYCITCHKAYEWIDYPRTDDETDDEEEIIYQGEEINEFENWLIKEKNWIYKWNSHYFYCSKCYIKFLEDELQKERTKSKSFFNFKLF